MAARKKKSKKTASKGSGRRKASGKKKVARAKKKSARKKSAKKKPSRSKKPATPPGGSGIVYRDPLREALARRFGRIV